MCEGIGDIIPLIFNLMSDGESSALCSDRFNPAEKTQSLLILQEAE